MNKSKKFSPEVRERAVRMVREDREEYPSLWAAVESIAPKIGCVPQTLLEWVKRAEIDAGARPGITVTPYYLHYFKSVECRGGLGSIW
jgi:transposase